MKVLQIPQRSKRKVFYSFNNEKITVNLNGQFDTFDFSTFEEGAIFEGVETDLPINPLVSAKREKGVLFVELLNFIDKDATEEEKFPTWQGVS